MKSATRDAALTELFAGRTIKAVTSEGDYLNADGEARTITFRFEDGGGVQLYGHCDLDNPLLEWSKF